jgi:hypothetical protein
VLLQVITEQFSVYLIPQPPLHTRRGGGLG